MGADAESSCPESRTDSWSPKGARNPWSAPTTELWASTRWDNPANGGKPDIRRYKHLQVR